jgi:hypothetical protein
VADTLQHLDKLGYNDGPPESAEFGVVDGEEIEIKVEHNLCLEGYKYSSMKIKFYKHLPLDLTEMCVKKFKPSSISAPLQISSSCIPSGTTRPRNL